MQIAGKRLCPFCTQDVPLESSLCIHCGRDLQVMKVAHSQAQKNWIYQVVPDGLKFGIAVAGEIKIHGLELGKARDLNALLNSVTDIEKAG